MTTGPRIARSALLTLGLAAPALAQAPAPPLVYAVQDLASLADLVLTWPADPLATSYEVLRADDVAGPFQPIATVPAGPAPSFRDAGAVPSPPNPLARYYLVRADGPGGSATSNLASKRSIAIPATPPSVPGTPIAMPFFYFPNGIPGTTQRARDVCLLNRDLVFVAQLVDACGTVRFQTCPPPIDVFRLRAGEGYFVRTSRATTLDVVGSHDPEYQPGGSLSVALPMCAACRHGGSPPWGRHLVSVPDHATARSAAALCAETAAAGQPLLAVRDVAIDVGGRDLIHFCGTALPDFALVPGRAVELLVRGDRAWQPEVR